MRRLVTWNVMSLDGRFEGSEPWDLSLHGTVWGEELEAFSLEQGEAVGTLLFGRATYEGMAAYWQAETGPIATFMNGVEKYVVSRSPVAASWSNGRQLQGEVPGAVAELKRAPGKDIYVFGSADLLSSLQRHDLVDEYRICLAPVVLGAGTPLFKPGLPALDLQLLEVRPLRVGGVILRYAPRSAE